MDAWVQVISAVGFPIFASLGLAWFVKYQLDTFNQQAKELREVHKGETDKMTEALNKNTLVIQKLCDKLDCDDPDKKEGAA